MSAWSTRLARALRVAGFVTVACGPVTAPTTPPTPVGTATQRGPGTAARPVDATTPADAGSPSEPASLLGTPHPVTVEAIAPDGRWAMVCQARRDTDGSGSVSVGVDAHGRTTGDTLETYFVEGSGEGDRVDSFVAASAEGAYVVYVRDGRLLLRNTRAATETDLSALGADSRDDRAAFAGHRAAAFDPRGQRLLYFAARGKRTVVVIRELATGAEHDLDPGPVEPWRAAFAGNDWIVVRVIGTDSNGNGRLEWPVPVAKSPRGCESPRPPFAVWMDHGDRDTAIAFRAAGGPPLLRPGLVSPMGAALLVREASGRLVLDSLPGTRELLPPACSARLLHLDVERAIGVASCGDAAKGPVPLVLVEPSRRTELGIALDGAPSDALGRPPARFVAVHPGPGTSLLDLDTRRAMPLAPGDSVVTVGADAALVRRGRALHRVTASGSLEKLAEGLVASPRVVVGQGAAYVAPVVARLDGAVRYLEVESRRVLAVAGDGRALVARAPFDADALAVGPLEWLEGAKSPP